MSSTPRLLLTEALPQLSRELDGLLRAEQRPKLADQLSSLRIVEPPRPRGFHRTLMDVMVGLFIGQAGFITWGLDGWLQGGKGEWWDHPRSLA